MSVPPPPPAVPQALLAPLFQGAGEMLKEMKAGDLPPSVRPLLTFDRRGFGSAAARAQLAGALASDEDFRSRVYEAFSERAEVRTVLEAFDPAAPADSAGSAALRDDLDLLASALVAVRPEGWEVALGVVVGFHLRRIQASSVDADREAFETRLSSATTARERAEAEAQSLRSRVDDLEATLREERAARRAREEALRSELAPLEGRAAELERELASGAEALEQERGARSRAEAALRATSQRASAAEQELQVARSDLARAQADLAEARSAEPLPQGLAGLGKADIDALAEASREGGGGGAEPAPRTSRVSVQLPPGVIGPSTAGLRAALFGPDGGDPAVVIDGYNVSMLAWGDDAPDTQRQRLCALLERLYVRTSRAVTVVFDGADVAGVKPPRRPGVRVLFSAPGEEADAVVVREVEALPLERPVIAVSSDRWVADHAEEAGALVVPSSVFIDFLRT